MSHTHTERNNNRRPTNIQTEYLKTNHSLQNIQTVQKSKGLLKSSRTCERCRDVLENVTLWPLEVLLVDTFGESDEGLVSAHRLCQLPAREASRDDSEHVAENQSVQFCWAGERRGFYLEVSIVIVNYDVYLMVNLFR